ncbi:MAG: Do family serine endopeptidase [Pseudomonadota bacterium]
MHRTFKAVLATIGFTLGSAVAPAAGDQGSLSLPNEGQPQNVMPSSFSDLSKRLMPAVVNITTQQTIAPSGLPQFPDGDPLERFNEFFGGDPDSFSQQGSLGSGFVISADGLVVTNNHVIENADEINVVFSDGKTLRAELIGTDEATDIAVLKVNQSDPFPYVDWADSDTADVGDWVMAIGNPFGFGGSVSVGIVSAQNRNIQSGNYDDYIQTDAAINRGNSGGPLFNLNGEVLGVNTAIISPTGGSVGLGFSIPANLARSISEQIIAFGEARRGWLGVNVQDVDEDINRAYGIDGSDGVLVVSIDGDGPAAKADIEVGDMIEAFDGKPIKDIRGLSRTVAETQIGKEVDVDLVRDGRRKTISLTLGQLDNGQDEPETDTERLESALTDNPLGVDFTELDDGDRRRYRISTDTQGVLVRSVSPNGPSFGKLQKGDVVIEMGFKTITSPTEALTAMDKAMERPRMPLLVRLYRRGQVSFVSIDLSAAS